MVNSMVKGGYQDNFKPFYFFFTERFRAVFRRKITVLLWLLFNVDTDKS